MGQLRFWLATGATPFIYIERPALQPRSGDRLLATVELDEIFAERIRGDPRIILLLEELFAAVRGGKIPHYYGLGDSAIALAESVKGLVDRVRAAAASAKE